MMNKQLSNEYLIWSCILIGILLPLSILFFDSPERDECYQALCVLEYRRSPLAPLTFFNGFVWLKLFGVTILNLRILNLLCHIVSIGLGCLVFLRITSDRLLTAMLFMTMSTASQVWAMHIYNWDTGCYPFAMLCLVASLAFWNKPSWLRLALLAVSTALLSLSRIPCVVGLPIISCIVAYRYRPNLKEMFVRTVFFVILYLSLSIIFLLLIYGSVEGILSAFSSENIITGHGVSDLDRYIERIMQITPQLATESMLPLLCMLAALIITDLRKKRLIVGILFLFLIEGCLLFLILAMPVRTFFCLLWLPCMFLWLYPVLRNLHKEGFFCNPGYIEWLSVLFMCLPIIGSDGFQERFMVLPILPVLAGVCYPYLKRYIRSCLLFLMFAAASMLLIKDAYYISQGTEMIGETVPRLKGIMVDRQNASSICAQVKVYEEIRNKGMKMAVVGDNRYPGAFLLGTDMLVDLHVFHLGDMEDDKPMYERELPKFDALMVFYPVYYYQDAISMSVNQKDNDDFEQFLIHKGFGKSEILYPNFVMYTR